MLSKDPCVNGPRQLRFRILLACRWVFIRVGDEAFNGSVTSRYWSGSRHEVLGNLGGTSAYVPSWLQRMALPRDKHLLVELSYMVLTCKHEGKESAVVVALWASKMHFVIRIACPCVGSDRRRGRSELYSGCWTCEVLGLAALLLSPMVDAPRE